MSEKDLPLTVGELTVPRYHEFNDAERFRDEAKSLVLSNAGEYNEAAHTLATVRALKDTLASEKRRYLGPFNEGIKRLRDWFKPAEDALDQAEHLLNKEMSRFALEDMRRQKQEEIENQRKADIEKARLERRADTAEKKGDHSTADMLRATASVGVVAAPVVSQTEAEGVSKRVVFKGRVTDKAALVKAVADGKAPITLLEVDETALNKVIGATKGEVQYPGVEIYQDVQFRRASK